MANMNMQEQISQDLGIPKQYLKNSIHDDLFICAVRKTWLRWLLKKKELPTFRRHEQLSDDEVNAWLQQGESPGSDWHVTYIRVLPKKRNKVIPLPRARVLSSKSEPPLTFSQLLHYVSQTNHKNLWKEAFKKYLSATVPLDGKEATCINCVDSEVVIADMINRVFGCPVIKVQGTATEEESTNSLPRNKKHEPHLNVLSAVCALDSPSHFYILHSPADQCIYTVHDCVTFSPAALGAAPPPPWEMSSATFSSSASSFFSLPSTESSSIARPLFVIYQLLQLMQDTHDRGLALGDLTLSHLLLADDGLWIKVLPCLLDNVHSVGLDNIGSSISNDQKISQWSVSQNTPIRHGRTVVSTAVNDSSMTTSLPQYLQPMELANQFCRSNSAEPILEQMMEQWVRGALSNFDYLMALNHLVGRRYDNPSYHPVLPWVIDFSTPNGGWRDLTKSKFRLNKGDRQLDLTFDAILSHHLESPGRPLLQVPHHVSDVLSEITYYVYMARRTPKSILCKHVRSKWVPAEYPSSIQRMHEWTPDECIPELFIEPKTFKSIHEDLPDLEVPAWAASPEHFVEKHRQALESAHVSERLHHWIDLTFGYKLSGPAAVRAKNVCLHLVDGHTQLANSGVVQLFSYPHPHRVLPSPYFGKAPPKLYFAPRDRKKPEKQERGEDEDHSIDDDDSLSRSLGFTKLLSRSRSSLIENKQQQQESGTKSSAGSLPISLPKDYNPAQPLLDVETLHGFLSKTLHKSHGVSTSSLVNGPPRWGESVNLKQAAAARRIREMQVLGCLVVELFLAPSFSALPRFVSITKRLALCRAAFLAERHALPPCVRHATSLLLQLFPDEVDGNLDLKSNDNTTVSLSPLLPFRYPTIMPRGLPPPSAHQLLQPSISLFPFPAYFPRLYALLRTLREYMTLREELEFMDHVPGVEEDEDSRKERQLLTEKVSECMVAEFASGLVPLLPDLGEEGVALILPHVRHLLEDPRTSVGAAWHLFEPVARALGPRKAGVHLLEPIARLFEREGPGAIAVGRISKLYHRSFVLKLSVWLGLGVFLDRFITSLVEAVGGYRDGPYGGIKRDSQESFGNTSMQSKRHELRSKSSEIEFPSDGQPVLSPLDEDSSADSERNASQKSGPRDDIDDKEDRIVLDEEGATDAELEPEVFVFEVGTGPEEEEAEVSGETNRGEGPIIDHLMDQLELHSDALSADRLSLNDSLGREEAEEYEEGDAVDDDSEQRIEEEANVDLSSHNQSAISYTKWSSYQQGEGSEVSSLSAETVSWLAHRLGPVLSARHLSRNLLRMLTLCFLGEENLTPITGENGRKGGHVRHPCCISGRKLYGDNNASKVLECLSSIAALYGEQLILLQYLPHMWELAALCRRKLTPTLEAGLLGCIALLIHIVPFLSDATLMDQLQDNILAQVLLPCIRLISSARASFPTGTIGRSALAAKVLDALHLLALRVGVEMTRRHLSPVLRRFFLAFDKAHGCGRGRSEKQGGAEGASVGTLSDGTPTSLGMKIESVKDSPSKSLDDSSFLEIRRDGTTAEWAIRGTHISHVRTKTDNDSTDSASTPPLSATPEGSSSFKPLSESRCQALEELKCVFSEEFAHLAYIPFFRSLGENVMEQTVQNEQLIRDLCFSYEQEMQHFQPEGESSDHMYLSDYLVPVGSLTHDKEASQSFGSNVAIIGNRIDLQRADIPSTLAVCSSPGIAHVSQESDMMSFISKKMENTSRHLRGNWLAYWEHEIGRSEKDNRFNFKQIKLQKFSGHGNSVRAVVVLDNENSFLSGSRDKTVKLWSLRSQGDGTAVSHCQWTYLGHRKSVLSVAMVEPLRLAASCDSALHLWDPFVGSPIRRLESTRYPPVCVLRPLPPPACTLLAATTDATLRLVDPRAPQAYLNDLKVSPSPWGLIRCVTVAPNGQWVAVGQSSGHLSILDIRTGLVLSSWKGHEGEVLQLVVVNENTLVSSSLDQAVSVWNVDDGKLKFNMKGPTEPVHCLGAYGSELISGTTANRIGVHTSLDEHASFSSTRLRSDAFRGVLTAMAVLPLNRLLLLGADNGSLTLLC